MTKSKIVFLVLCLSAFPGLAQQFDEKESLKKAKEMGLSYDDYIKLKKYYEDQKGGAKFDQRAKKKEGAKDLYRHETMQSDSLYWKQTLKHYPADTFFVPSFKGRKLADSLSAFGYQYFTYKPVSFTPYIDAPVSNDYIVGPGDEIILTLWGETETTHNLEVTRSGAIFIPEVGLINVSGLSLRELKTKLYSILSQRYSSLSISAGGTTKLDVTTGKLRTIKVFLIGLVNYPGSYVLPSLSTAFTALYYGGGPSINGSLRDIRIMRNGKQIYSVDLYEYFTKGNKSADIQLDDGDVVYVPPAGKRAAFAGSVVRQGIFELKEKENLGDLIRFTGGIKFDADYKRIHIERIVPFDQRANFRNSVLSLDFEFEDSQSLLKSNNSIEDGDVVSIDRLLYRNENKISIKGFVYKPGDYELSDGMRIKDLINKAGGLLPEAFKYKGVLVRTRENEKKEIISFDINSIVKESNEENILLKNRDEIYLLNNETFFPTRSVRIKGAVNEPGYYERFENMTLLDLILLAGGLKVEASTIGIEIARMDTLSQLTYAKRIIVDFPSDYWNVDRSQDVYLYDFDEVLIKPDPRKTTPMNIIVQGEVNSPGEYAILYEGERISDFIKRANGFKNTAYKKGIYVKRYDPIFSKVQRASIPDSIIFDQGFYDRNLFKEYSYRIPVLWDEIEKDENSIYNFPLKTNDTLFVSKNPNSVIVLGEVGLPSSVIYKKGKGVEFYIRQAGGYTQNSDKGNEIVILPNGRKWEPSGFFLIPDDDISSGSLIIVPAIIRKETDYWATVRDIFSIVSSAAVIVLTIKSLN